MVSDESQEGFYHLRAGFCWFELVNENSKHLKSLSLPFYIYDNTKLTVMFSF